MAAQAIGAQVGADGHLATTETPVPRADPPQLLPSALPDYVRELLSEKALREIGLFNTMAVGQLVQKAEGGARLTEVDDMALVGILSTQLVRHRFCQGFASAAVGEGDRIKVVDRVVA